jgi:ABC-type Fe3+-hydroxamate transport system substrate-binding protein
VRGGKVNIETLQNRPGWSTLAAIKSNKVYYVDEGIEDPSPVAVNALEEMAKEFHP